MNEQAINQIKEAIREMMRLIVQRGESLSEETKQMVSEAMAHAQNRIQQLRQEEQQPEPIPEPEQPNGGNPPPPEENLGFGAAPSPDAQLLFILSGQKEDIFINYLQQYQTPQTVALLNNPQELERVIKFLHEMMPSTSPEIDGDIQHTETNSSTIWGTHYDAKTGKMKVRFQGGDEYLYSGVPPNIYKAVIEGQHAATTNGQNAYGRWWKNKVPSIGSAFDAYVKKGKFPYQKIN